MTIKKQQTKILGARCDSQIMKETTVDLHGSMSSFLGILQALQYAIMHKDDFKKVASDCPDCFQSIVSAQEYLAGLISQAVKHEAKHKN